MGAVRTYDDSVLLTTTTRVPGQSFGPADTTHVSGVRRLSSDLSTNGSLSTKDLARFWGQVDKSGDCWLWTGAKGKHGYGQIKIAGKLHYAHRLAYEIQQHGRRPKRLVCHHCDSPLCVRKEHLYAGSHKSNARDAAARETQGPRAPCGCNQPGEPVTPCRPPRPPQEALRCPSPPLPAKC
jgi:hypothetical protein